MDHLLADTVLEGRFLTIKLSSSMINLLHKYLKASLTFIGEDKDVGNTKLTFNSETQSFLLTLFDKNTGRNTFIQISSFLEFEMRSKNFECVVNLKNLENEMNLKGIASDNDNFQIAVSEEDSNILILIIGLFNKGAILEYCSYGVDMLDPCYSQDFPDNIRSDQIWEFQLKDRDNQVFRSSILKFSTTMNKEDCFSLTKKSDSKIELEMVNTDMDEVLITLEIVKIKDTNEVQLSSQLKYSIHCVAQFLKILAPSNTINLSFDSDLFLTVIQKEKTENFSIQAKFGNIRN